MTTKLAKDLLPGDRIPPPAYERSWLKTPLTVVNVADGLSDKGGPWLKVSVIFTSPYGNGKTSESVFRFRPGTVVRLCS